MTGSNRTSDRVVRWSLAGITISLAAIALALWDGDGSVREGILAPATASAQVPDTGKQRLDMVNEQKRTNQLLEQILEHLRTKPVRMVEVKEKAGNVTTGAARP